MKTIYLIQQSSGSYEDYHVHNLGFCETEEEARRTCMELNAKMPHNPFINEEDEDKFQELHGEWVYKEQELWEEADEQNPYTYGKETADAFRYNAWIEEHKIEETIEAEKLKFFESHDPILQDRPWSEVLEEYEAWSENLVWDLDDVTYVELKHI